ncbi:hypothetical protein AB3S75_042777 [Citrus x aurantiifolia]
MPGSKVKRFGMMFRTL